MMYGYWQQSLTLCAQLLFAPAVNPQVERGKQNSREHVMNRGRGGAGGLSVTQGQSYCGLHLWLYTNNTDWESICHWIFHTDNVCSSKCPHPAAVAQKAREEKAFMGPDVQALTFGSPTSLNDQVTPYWSQPSFKAKNLKPYVAHSMTCCRCNVVGYGSLRAWCTSICLTAGFWIRVSDSCRTMLMAALL